MVQLIIMWDEIMLFEDGILYSYLIINGLMQLYFVSWILWRNKKLTFLLSEYYRNN